MVTRKKAAKVGSAAVAMCCPTLVLYKLVTGTSSVGGRQANFLFRLLGVMLYCFCVAHGLRTAVPSFVSKRAVSSLSTASREYEVDLIARGYSHIIGVDEAGRGPLAGPVVAGAVCIVNPSIATIALAADSKTLTDARRRLVVDELLANPLDYAVAWFAVPHHEIDRVNILQATMIAMRAAIEEVVNKTLSDDQQKKPSYYGIIDGNKTPAGLSIPARPLVRGDALCYSVALASCVAKVARDDIMLENHLKYPLWSFDKHKGYPTKDHIRLIGLHGPSPIHRMSFQPLKGRASTAPLIFSSLPPPASQPSQP